MWYVGTYGQCHECYCFVTLTFNLKVTDGHLKSDFGHFSHFGPVLIYRKLDHPMAGIYNTYISSVTLFTLGRLETSLSLGSAENLFVNVKLRLGLS